MSFSFLKGRVVGTALGDTLSNIRSFVLLRRIPFSNPEMAASVSNSLISSKLIVGLCDEQSVFLDVGAHIGSVLASVKRAHPTVQIFAIEADPKKARDLKYRFSDCTILDCAIDETPGTATFFFDNERPGYNSLANRGNASGSLLVTVKTLDELLPVEMIDVIKIDIEGAELGALRGGQALLARCRPIIMFESTGVGENVLGHSPEGLWEFFDHHAYKLFTPDRVAHDAPSLDLSSFIDAHHYPVRSRDFFAVPTEKRISTRDKAREILKI